MRGARTVAGWLLLLGSILPAPASPQISTDGSLGPEVSLPGFDVAIPASLGQFHGDASGGNLFHSFLDFNIQAGGSATFVASAVDSRGIAVGPVHNVISRVTGGEQSNILGQLRSTIGGSDFWFLNPAGIVFGPNSSLDLKGSFTASTTQSLAFPNGEMLETRDGGLVPELAVAPPSAFGFLGDSSAKLTVMGLLRNSRDISLSGAVVEFPSGGLISTSDPFAPNTKPGDISVVAADRVSILGGTASAPTGLQSSANNAGNGGSITIEARVIEVLNGGSVTSITSSSLHDGGIIRLAASDLILVSGTTQASAGPIPSLITSSSVRTDGGSVGDGGALILEAPRVHVLAGAEIREIDSTVYTGKGRRPTCGCS